MKSDKMWLSVQGKLDNHSSQAQLLSNPAPFAARTQYNFQKLTLFTVVDFEWPFFGEKNCEIEKKTMLKFAVAVANLRNDSVSTIMPTFKKQSMACIIGPMFLCLENIAEFSASKTENQYFLTQTLFCLNSFEQFEFPPYGAFCLIQA